MDRALRPVEWPKTWKWLKCLIKKIIDKSGYGSHLLHQQFAAP